MKRAWTIPVVILLALVGLWEAGSRLSGLPDYILPPPSQILHVAVGRAPQLLPHAGITLVEILAGILLALAVAIPLAVAMFARPSLEKALAPFLVASQAIPVFALAPLLVVWLGYGLASKILMAAVIIFFPISVSLLEGFKSCDPAYRVLFRLMGADFWQALRRLYWPWALPYFFAGLRVGVSVATIGAVIGEWMGAQQGLGYLMIQSNARLKTDWVFAAILWLSLMGIALWHAVGWLEQYFMAWKNLSAKGIGKNKLD